MAYTEKQWNNFQASLPEEERMSYLDYLKETDLAAYNRLVSKILENLKTAELQSGTPITKVVDEGTKFAGAKTDTAAQKAAVKAAAKVVPNFRASEAASAKTDSAATVSVSAVEGAAATRAAEAKAITDKAAEDKRILEEAARTAELNKKIQAALARFRSKQPLSAEDKALLNIGADFEYPLDEEGNPIIVETDTNYTAVDGVLMFKGAPFTGTYEGKEYENGKLKVTPPPGGGDYTTVNGVLTFKNAPFTGTYDGKTYKDGKVIETPSGGDYETVGGLLVYKGTAFTGSYNGKKYKNGFLEEEQGGDKYTTVNGVLTLNGKAFTGVYENKEYKDGVEVTPGADDYETVNGLLVYKGTAFTGTYNGKKYKNGFVEEEPGDGQYTTVNGLLTFKGSPFTGAYNGKNYKDGKVVEEPDAEEYTTVNGILTFKNAPFTGNYQGKNYKDGKIVEAAGDQYTTVNGLFSLNGKPFTGAYQGKNYKDGKLVAADDAADDTTDDAAAILAKAGRQSAYDLLYTQFASYGLGSLVEPLKALIGTNVSPSEFALKLRNDPLYNKEYKKRFSANDMRISKGLKAIDEATYLGLEDQYQSILRNAGLPESYWKRGELGIQEGFTNFIANDVSATELEDRVNTAQQRLIYANPEVSIALKTFYPDISNGDLLAYALDPTKGLDQIKRRITAAEIGSSAVQMGLATNVTDAEYLARYGVDKGTAQKGYRTAAETLPTATKLGEIYAGQGLGAYTQQTAEQDIFNLPGGAAAAEKRRKLSELEQASFSGRAGMGALARDRAGAF